LLFNELAPVSLCNTLADGCTKAGVVLKQTQRGLLHQSLGIGALLGGDLRQLPSCSGVKCSSVGVSVAETLRPSKSVFNAVVS
jgi:hypothetical protein